MQRSYSDIMIQSDRVVGSNPPKKEWCQRFTSFRQKPGRGGKDPVGIHSIFSECCNLWWPSRWSCGRGDLGFDSRNRLTIFISTINDMGNQFGNLSLMIN